MNVPVICFGTAGERIFTAKDSSDSEEDFKGDKKTFDSLSSNPNSCKLTNNLVEHKLALELNQKSLK